MKGFILKFIRQKEKNLVTFLARIPADIKQRLEKIAKATNISQSQIIVDCLKKELANMEKIARPAELVQANALADWIARVK